MKTITTKELADMFGIGHRNIKRTIKGLPHSDLFSLDKYKSSQNKPIEIYRMDSRGLGLLLSRACFQRGGRMIKNSELLNEFGIKSEVKLYERKSGEDEFYGILCRFFPDEKITRQYSIAGYLVDFYLNDYCLIIEFDEEYHNSKKARVADKKREGAISNYVLNADDEKQHFIRVRSGLEIEGLAKVAGFMALNSSNCECITRLFEG